MGGLPIINRLLEALLYFPSREIVDNPARAGLASRDLAFETVDGERLRGWWIPAAATPPRGHVLLCHGNAGNVGDRVLHAALLCGQGFDVLLFDYRGYGASTGRPTEQGTYRDARAARSELAYQPEVDPARILYLGESLGGAVALELAVESPPAGLILQSTFTSVRDVGRRHYPFVPERAIPDAYPSLRRIGRLRAPLLVLHGERDEIVPVEHGRALFRAAPEPKRMHVFPGASHNDLLTTAGPQYLEAIARWAAELTLPTSPAG